MYEIRSVTSRGPGVNEHYTLPERRVTYNYRYFLPYPPDWGTSAFCEKRFQELLVFCREARMDAVQFYVNFTPATYYMPPHSAAEQEPWARWIRESVAPRLRASGVSFQINLVMLLGALPYELDMRDEYPWGFLVNHEGREALGCACPIDPVFREVMGEMLRLWAGTGPDVIWIDDDFRIHNHGLGQNGLDFYCYCSRHLRAFAEFAGREFTREELVGEIMKPGAPSPVRAQWLDFLGKSMTETAAWVRRQAHAVSPQTRLAQMTSFPEVHSAEGRDWKAFLTSLSGGYRPMTRPCCGIYSGTMVPVKDNTISFRLLEQSMITLEQTLGRGAVDYGSELENTRFTTWAKSTSNTRYFLTLSQLLGCRQITIDVSDADGSPINEEPSIVPLFRSAKAQMQALAKLDLRAWNPVGAAFICDPEAARKQRLAAGAKMQDLGGLAPGWKDALLQLGLPAKYLSCEQAASSPELVVLDSYSACCPSDDQLRGILSGAVLADAGAAEVLQQRGFGRFLGVKVGTAPTFGVISEVYLDNVLPGVHACRVPHRGFSWRELELDGAQLASRFTDAKKRDYVGSTIYVNELKGRVAVYASIGDLSPQGVFGSHARCRWLQGLLRWLSQERFPVLPSIPHHGLTLVRTDSRETIVAFANLGTDALKEFKFRAHFRNTPTQIKALNPQGTWRERKFQAEPAAAPGSAIITVPCRLATFDWLILKIADTF